MANVLLYNDNNKIILTENIMKDYSNISYDRFKNIIGGYLKKDMGLLSYAFINYHTNVIKYKDLINKHSNILILCVTDNIKSFSISSLVEKYNSIIHKYVGDLNIKLFDNYQLSDIIDESVLNKIQSYIKELQGIGIYNSYKVYRAIQNVKDNIFFDIEIRFKYSYIRNFYKLPRLHMLNNISISIGKFDGYDELLKQFRSMIFQ